jgi:hypothetical protein
MHEPFAQKGPESYPHDKQNRGEEQPAFFGVVIIAVACNDIYLYTVSCNKGAGMVGVAKRVQKHRINLRKSGLRPLQIWVPDTRRQGFAKECERQSALVKFDPQEKEVLTFIEGIADFRGWEP